MTKPTGEPRGRPKNLVRRHIIEIKEDTRDWLEEQINGVKAAFVTGKTVRAAGETAKGILSHPVGFAAIGLPIIALIVTMLIKKNQEDREKDSNVPNLKRDYENWEESFINAFTGPIRQIPGGDTLISTWLQAGRAIRDSLASVVPDISKEIFPPGEGGIPEVLKPFFPPPEEEPSAPPPQVEPPPEGGE